MDHASSVNIDQIDSQFLRRINKSQLQGAYARAGASAIMWLMAALSLIVGHMGYRNVKGITLAVLFLILINPPVLWGLKRITRKSAMRFYATGIHALEITGYTAVIHYIGGIKALYLSPIYAALITFVGAMGPPRQAFTVAGLCAVALIGLIGLEFFGILENLCPFSDAVYPIGDQVIIVSANIFLLFIVAFMTAYTSKLLRQSKKRLKRQNQGTGLGLAITRKMVELHGGKIWAESDGEGHVATFSFTIPMAPNLSNNKTSGAVHPSPEATGHTA